MADDDITQETGRVRRVQRSELPGAVRKLVKQAEESEIEARRLRYEARQLRVDSQELRKTSPGSYSLTEDELEGGPH